MEKSKDFYTVCLKKVFNVFFKNVYECSDYMCLTTTCIPSAFGGQKNMLENLGLQLWPVVSPHMDNGNQI